MKLIIAYYYIPGRDWVSEALVYVAGSDYGKEFIRDSIGMPLKLIGGVYVLHGEEGEAILHGDGRHVSFCHDGHRRCIEDMPWSDEVRLMVKLRYGDCDWDLKYLI